MIDRILWNERPAKDESGCIDEIVLHDAQVVHVEQMDGHCWWISIHLADGSYWSGHFVADEHGQLRFVEQESTVMWHRDESHAAPPGPDPHGR